MRLTCIRNDDVHFADPFFDKLCGSSVISLVTGGDFDWNHSPGVLCIELGETACGRERPDTGEDDSVRASSELLDELQAETTTSTGNYESVSDVKCLDVPR